MNIFAVYAERISIDFFGVRVCQIKSKQPVECEAGFFDAV